MFFAYEWESRYRWLCRLWGAQPARDGVDVTEDGRFVATFGRFRVDTPIENVTGAHITEDYHWYKAIGVRGSFADDGVTFGTSTRHGVCVHFGEPIPRVIGFQRGHSALTVTVEDATALVEAIEART